jgi:hypothetical protein
VTSPCPSLWHEMSWGYGISPLPRHLLEPIRTLSSPHEGPCSLNAPPPGSACRHGIESRSEIESRLILQDESKHAVSGISLFLPRLHIIQLIYPHLLSSQSPSDSWHIFDLQNREDEFLTKGIQKMKRCLLCKGSNHTTLWRSQVIV